MKAILWLRRRLTSLGVSLVWISLAVVTHAQPPTPNPSPTPASSPASPASPTPGFTPAPVQTAAPAEEAKPDFQFNGFVESSYNYNFNLPSDGKNLFQGYNEKANSLRLDVLELNFQYALDQPGRTGFRLDIDGGGTMPRAEAAAGLFRDAYTGYSATVFDIRQVFVSHTFDNGLRMDAGKFASHLGYEVMDGVDGRNPNGTRSLAFYYSPFTHTGLKLSYPINDKLSVMAMAALGADNWQDTNRSFSFGGQLNYHPTDRFTVVANVFMGPEQIRNDTNQRQLLELISTWKFHDQLTLGLHGMTGVEQGLGLQGGTANWNALVVYLLADISDEFSLNLRHEWFNDPEGARLGQPARVRSLTLTPEYRITPDWVVRIDFRFDNADRPVYNRRGTPVSCQTVIFLGQSYRF